MFAVLKEKEPFIESLLKYFTLERGILIGSIIFLVGLFIAGRIFVKWLQTSFGGFFQPGIVILASTILIIGLQLIFNVFYLSILGIERR